MHNLLCVVSKFVCQSGQERFTLQIKLFLPKQFFQTQDESLPITCGNYAQVPIDGQFISTDLFIILTHPLIELQ